MTVEKGDIGIMKYQATFEKQQDAQKYIQQQLTPKTYILSHGEYARPDYKVRKLRNKSRYYIHVTHYFYANTLNAPSNGPLTLIDE